MDVVAAPRPAEGKVGDDLLSVTDLDFSYGRVQVLFDMNLTVQRGEALALLGTNGAGKSTLLRVICGLERPSRGRIVFGGTDITGLPAESLPSRGLVLVSGGRSVFPDMTVAENFDILSLTVRKRASWLKQRRTYALDVFPQLRRRLSHRAGMLSGGEQQQLALAKAILLDPELLCIDELSLGLAPVVVQELLSTVQHIHATGVTVLLVEQSLNIAAATCERAVFMEKGQTRFEGNTNDLLEREDIVRAVFLGGD